MEASDRSPLAAAIRETREELALDLERQAALIGQLSHVDAIGRGRRVGLVILPYVFAVQELPKLEPNHEVQEAVWIPLSFFVDRGNRSTMRWRRLGIPIPLPCYRWQGRLVWGLTLMMVDELTGIVAAASPIRLDIRMSDFTAPSHTNSVLISQ